MAQYGHVYWVVAGVKLPRLQVEAQRRRRGIERILHSHRYRVTDQGLTDAMFLSAVHDRLLPTCLAELRTTVPALLHAPASTYQKAIDTLTHAAGFAA